MGSSDLEARTLLASADGAVANMQRSLRGEVGTLTIGFFVGSTVSFFPPIMKEFKRRFQEVQVSLVEMSTAMHHKALQAGTIEVAFTRPAPPSDVATVHFEHLHSGQLSAVMPKSHPLAKKGSIFIRELADERFILVDRNQAPFPCDKVISLCAEAGFSPRIGTTASNAVGVVALVEAGEGVAVLSHSGRGKEVVFVPLADHAAFIDLVIAWAPQHENPVLRSFLDVALKKRRKP